MNADTLKIEAGDETYEEVARKAVNFMFDADMAMSHWETDLRVALTAHDKQERITDLLKKIRAFRRDHK